ncbi:type II toxin-antitoxin system RelE family toxin [Thermus sp.]|uniref:type II toxin-antitoxin system RelE family toxin n=1 Tax=Thermus sp. TaxID=275 RepID=UPI003D12AB9B
MGYRIEFDPRAVKELERLDREVARRILRFLRERVAALEDPRSLGEPLRGPELGRFWKYRVGDYRLICHIRDQEATVLVVRVGHRRDVYR